MLYEWVEYQEGTLMLSDPDGCLITENVIGHGVLGSGDWRL